MIQSFNFEEKIAAATEASTGDRSVASPTSTSASSDPMIPADNQTPGTSQLPNLTVPQHLATANLATANLARETAEIPSAPPYEMYAEGTFTYFRYYYENTPAPAYLSLPKPRRIPRDLLQLGLVAGTPLAASLVSGMILADVAHNTPDVPPAPTQTQKQSIDARSLYSTPTSPKPITPERFSPERLASTSSASTLEATHRSTNKLNTSVRSVQPTEAAFNTEIASGDSPASNWVNLSLVMNNSGQATTPTDGTGLMDASGGAIANPTPPIASQSTSVAPSASPAQPLSEATFTTDTSLNPSTSIQQALTTQATAGSLPSSYPSDSPRSSTQLPTVSPPETADPAASPAFSYPSIGTHPAAAAPSVSTVPAPILPAEAALEASSLPAPTLTEPQTISQNLSLPPEATDTVLSSP